MSEPRQPIGQPIVYPGLSSWKSQIIGYKGFLFQKNSNSYLNLEQKINTYSDSVTYKTLD